MPDPALVGAASLLGAGGVLAAGGFLAHAARGRSSTVFGPSVYHGDRARNALALTFDDGPSEFTPALLDVLARHNARATFFMCGKNVERLPHIARQVAEAGHEIGNHSDTHPRFDFCSAAFMERELAAAQEKISRHAGVTPALFRAPYGVRWFGLRGVQRRLHLLGVMWTILARDWKWPAERVSSLLLERSGNGDILCLHDGRTTKPAPDIRATIEAVRTLLPRLEQKGLRFETVSQILCPHK